VNARRPPHPELGYEAGEPPCATCGCTSAKRCQIEADERGYVAICMRRPGATTCSGCARTKHYKLERKALLPWVSDGWKAVRSWSPPETTTRGIAVLSRAGTFAFATWDGFTRALHEMNEADARAAFVAAGGAA
jgi:hypothetical protein